MTVTVDKPDSPPPLMLGRKAAAAACGKGTSTWDRLCAAGLTPKPIRLGGSVLWLAEELIEWCRHGCPARSEWSEIWRAINRHRCDGRVK